MISFRLVQRRGRVAATRDRSSVLALAAVALFGLSLALGVGSASASVPDAPERTDTSGVALPAIQRAFNFSIVDPNVRNIIDPND